jgi:hypothetical protein
MCYLPMSYILQVDLVIFMAGWSWRPFVALYVAIYVSSHLLNLCVLAVCRNNLQLHVFRTNGFELVILCFMCSSELVMCLHSTFQAQWSVRRRLTVFYGCRSLAGGATTLPLPVWGLCFLLLRALIGNLDHMYFFIILGHVGKSYVENKTLARSRETVGTL